MNVCRICLSPHIYEEIARLQLIENGENLNFTDVIIFCTNIKVLRNKTLVKMLQMRNSMNLQTFNIILDVILNSNISSYICMNCYKQMVCFYKFKQLALQNDKYLQSLELNEDKETELFQNKDVKDENICDNGLEVKQELVDTIISDIKQEVELEAADDRIESDDEVLSVIKQHKENVLEFGNGQDIPPIKCSRGRPKKIKVGTQKETKQVCEECGKAVRNLREHSRQHQPKGERKIIQCKSCSKTFSGYSARYKHYKRKHLDIKTQCNICSKFVSSIRNHMLVVHHPDKLQFVCISCDRRFITQSVLDIHMRNHTKDKPFECVICEKKFKTKLLMDSHKRQVHDQERSHLCQYCSKSFFKKYHLQLHLRSHTKEKPCKCDECGKYFQSTSILNIHKRIHKGVKDFACSLCDMKFYRQGALATHMISHTKVKNYPCQFCGVSFGRSDHRNRHERTAHLKHIIK